MIAKEIGLSVQTVYRILRQEGVQPLRGQTIAHLDNHRLGLLIERYVRGDPLEDIRREASVSLSTFYQLLDDAGVPRRHETYLAERKQAGEDALTMYKAGKRLWQIKQATGISSSTLSNAIMANNIPRRRPNYGRRDEVTPPDVEGAFDPNDLESDTPPSRVRVHT